ncbi:MAG TPA: NAD-dependent epimerase/dehydratase family protein [Magnetospirillaceae bacterium]|nr:NAD-dependent epimerase/dehydratase family protein [Magnetospirillaceae bacterium]
MGFAVLIVGGTGQVGSAVVRALLAVSSCTEVVMVNRRTAPLTADARLRQVVLDTGAPNFADEIAALARSMGKQGDPIYAASCIGIGAGSARWSDEDIRKLEIGVVGAFARGCLAAEIERFGLLSAAGSSPKSRIRYARIMGEKEEAVRSLGFKRLALYRPGIIAGNAHTPGYLAWLGRLIPGPFGTIDQDDIGRAFAGEFLHGQDGTTILGNAEMKRRLSRPAIRGAQH